MPPLLDEPTDSKLLGESPAESASPAVADTVEVRPAERDADIQKRLTRILVATDWFSEPTVEVEEGVVFLAGSTPDADYRDWAGELARKTRDVVAVVNRIEVHQPSVWNFQPALAGLRDLQRDFAYSLPFLALSLLILAAFFLAAKLAARLLRRATAARIQSGLLREVLARSFGMLLFLLGVYLVLRVLGLTRLAITLLGGTGLLGLVLGIAFRDITENFLASILLSMQRPFRAGDLIEVADVVGYVQQLNIRTTVLMSLTGNHIQIPNATIYKNKIRNYSSNPNRREDFLIGIGYDAPISRAQEIALQVLREHPAVLDEPEPWVLADHLGSATVNLRVYFWLDGRRHSWLKVRSSVIRLVKRAFQEQNISIPDEAREVVFPRGVPVRLTDDRGGEAAKLDGAPREEAEAVSSQSEAGLTSDAPQIEQQARQSQSPDEGEDLLK